MPKMTDEQLRIGAEFYGISTEEARRRNEVMLVHVDDPEDPICMGCVRRPQEIPIYVEFAEWEAKECERSITPTKYVQENEGTFNWNNGHFLCDECYIKNGQPSSPTGWTCP